MNQILVSLIASVAFAGFDSATRGVRKRDDRQVEIFVGVIVNNDVRT